MEKIFGETKKKLQNNLSILQTILPTHSVFISNKIYLHEMD